MFLSFVTVWVFCCCHNLSFCTFWDLLKFEFCHHLSFVKVWALSKGTADHPQFCAYTDGNHTCTQFSQLFFGRNLFFCMLTKEYVFVFENFQLLHELRNKDNLSSASYLLVLHLYEHLGKAASVFRNTVHLFVSKLCWCKAQRYMQSLWFFCFVTIWVFCHHFSFLVLSPF